MSPEESVAHTSGCVKTLTINLTNKLVNSVYGVAAEPASGGYSHKMIKVPYDHAVSHNRMDIHGVK